MHSVDCAVCMTSYDNKAHRPVLGTCGHSLCLSCLKPIQQTSRGSCPICVRMNAFNETKFNFQMIELIEVTEQKKRSELREATNQAKTVKELERVKAELKKTRENTAKRNKSATPKLVANKKKTEQKTGNSADANSFVYEPTTRKEPMASSRKKSNNPVVTTEVFVNNLELDITNNILYNLFERYGTVTSTKVLRRQDGKSKGCGFVRFETKQGAVNAMTELNSYMLGSKRIRISLAEERTPPKKRPATSARLPVQSVQVSRLSPVSPLNSARRPANSRVTLNSASERSNSTTGPLNHVRESSNLTRRAFDSDGMPLNSVREPLIPAREQMDTTRWEWTPDIEEFYSVQIPSREESESDSSSITFADIAIVSIVACLHYYIWKKF